MGTKVASEVEIRVSAKNDTAAGLRAAEGEFKRSMRAFYETQGRAANRGFVEQSVRDEMAARIKAMRAEAQRTKIDEETNMRLFGMKSDPAKIRRESEEFIQNYVRGLKDAMQRQQGQGGGGLFAGGPLKLAGIAIGAEFIGGAIKSAGLAAKEWAEGSLTAGQAIVKLGEGIPIIGNVVKGFHAGADALKAWHDRLNGVTQRMKDLKELEAARARVAEEEARNRAKLDVTSEIVRQAGLIGAPESERRRSEAIEKRKTITKQIVDLENELLNIQVRWNQLEREAGSREAKRVEFGSLLQRDESTRTRISELRNAMLQEMRAASVNIDAARRDEQTRRTATEDFWKTWNNPKGDGIDWRAPLDSMKSAVARAFTDRLNEFAGEMKAAGKAVTDSLRTPSEAYADTVQELTRMLKMGVITQETFDRGAKRAAEERDRGKGRADARSTFTVEQGAFMFGGRNPGESPILKTQQQTAKNTQDTVTGIKSLETMIERLITVVTSKPAEWPPLLR